jgi:hypothetical protein
LGIISFCHLAFLYRVSVIPNSISTASSSPLWLLVPPVVTLTVL